MATKNAFTQKEFFEAIITHAQECGDIQGLSANEVIAFCKKKIAQLENKTSKGDTKRNSEHRKVMDLIIGVLSNADKPMKAGEITKAINAENGTEYTPNKIISMLRKLLPATDKNPDGTGEVIRIEDKKDVFFALSED